MAFVTVVAPYAILKTSGDGKKDKPKQPTKVMYSAYLNYGWIKMGKHIQVNIIYLESLNLTHC